MTGVPDDGDGRRRPGRRVAGADDRTQRGRGVLPDPDQRGHAIRPDLFDPHTVHFHGFPQSSTIFDGLPESGISINMGASLTYYYKINEPGTYMYHCHVEATEHMQMGMLGNLYVRPGPERHTSTLSNGPSTQFAYNDGDGSTGYDVDYPHPAGRLRPRLPRRQRNVQPLPFAADAGRLPHDQRPRLPGHGRDRLPLPAPPENGGKVAQPVSSLIPATAGQRILLRISNLNVTRFYTLTSSGIPMRSWARTPGCCAVPDGTDLYYTTNSVTLGGGEAYDVILDTAGVSRAPTSSTATNLN